MSVYYNLSSIKGFDDTVNNKNVESNIIKINKVECRSNNMMYTVVTYDKSMLAHDLIPTFGLCRSIILNSENKLVSFAPPKSVSSEEFIRNYSEKTDGVVAEEFVEGTMINVFWDPAIGLTGGWEISTRNIPGATSRFFKNYTKSKTFRDMFLEAANEEHLLINLLNPYYCYSFVLQHPENRIVVPIKKPQLYLVGVYAIHQVENNILVEMHDHQNLKENFEKMNVTVKFPNVYAFNTYAELIEKYASMNTPYETVGVVLHNKKTGERTKIRNPVYEEVRSLRGNQPKLQYQYLQLRKNGKVREFLNYYPENKKDFSKFRDQLHLFTDTLFNNYKMCYIKKQKLLKEYPNQYRTHMFNIHQFYLTELREKKEFITNTIVQKYVNDIHPSLLMYCLNYHMQKRYVDTIK